MTVPDHLEDDGVVQHLLWLHDEVESLESMSYVSYLGVLSAVGLVCLVLGVARWEPLALALAAATLYAAYRLFGSERTRRRQIRTLKRQIRQIEEGAPRP